MSWLQIHIEVSEDQVPLVELLFDNLGALSVTLGAGRDEAILEPDPGEVLLWKHTRVTALFPGDRDADRLRHAINRTLNRELGDRLRIDPLDDQPWERAWLQDFHPMRFGNRLWVCPHGPSPEAQDAVTLWLDPGLAFGTGTHPTTALCLEWLDHADLQGKTVIDYGCGSGILAIAALRLGAAWAVGVDHDPQALEASRTNAAGNGVLDRLRVCGHDQPSPWQADVLLCNILASALIELKDTLTARVKPGGTVILSGILNRQAQELSAVYRDDFHMLPPTTRGDWAMLEGRRRPATG